MFFEWSPIRSSALATNRISRQRLIVRGSSIMNVMSWRRIERNSVSTTSSCRTTSCAACDVEARERVERLAQHREREPGDVPDLDARHVHPVGLVDQLRHAGDLLGLVADALEVGDGLDDRDDQPQVARGRLAASDDVAARLVELDLHARSRGGRSP